MSRMSIALLTTVLIGLAAIGVFFWWQRTPELLPKVPEIAEAGKPVASAPEPVEAPSHFPIPEPAEPVALPSLAQSDKPVVSALVALLGQPSVFKFLQTYGFVRRVVVTVDNLGRPHAAPSLWPVNPTAGRFHVIGSPGAESIASDNAQRYAPLLVMAEGVDMRHAAAVYIRFYPLFQQAYEELGYPGKYFNDRLVAVIDGLLATPEPAGPIAVRLTEVKGPQRQLQPWVHYEFADARLEQLPAGQKMLLRMGPVNERRVKIKLRELRAAVTSTSDELKAAPRSRNGAASAVR